MNENQRRLQRIRERLDQLKARVAPQADLDLEREDQPTAQPKPKKQAGRTANCRKCLEQFDPAVPHKCQS